MSNLRPVAHEAFYQMRQETQANGLFMTWLKAPTVLKSQVQTNTTAHVVSVLHLSGCGGMFLHLVDFII